MTSPDAPFTHAEAEALEGRLITRIAEMEVRLVRDLNTAFWRQVAILLTFVALLAAVAFFVFNNLYAAIDRLSRVVT